MGCKVVAMGVLGAWLGPAEPRGTWGWSSQMRRVGGRKQRSGVPGRMWGGGAAVGGEVAGDQRGSHSWDDC